MSNAHNNVYESASSNITVWQSIDWNKVEQYVGKQRATSQGQKFVMHLNDACQCNSIKGIDNVVVQVILP